MKPIYALLVLTLAFGATACGPKKLTDEQKAIVSTTVESAGRTHSAVPGGQAAMLPSRFAVTNRFHALSWIAGERASTISTDPKTIEMKDKLDDPEVCNIEYPLPSSSTANATSFSVKIKVSGATCPISMDIAMSGSGTPTSAKIDASLKYAALTAEYKALNDVDSFDIAGGLELKVSQSSSSAELDVSGDVSGKIHSQAQGDITFKLAADVNIEANASGADGSGDVTLTLEFKDFSAELKQSFDGTTSKYEINGEEVTEAEFQAYFDKAGVSPVSTTP